MSADKDLISVQQARDLVEGAHKAQAEIVKFDQAKIDRICEAMSQAALREATRLGAMAVEETGFGVADDKREKNRFAAEDVWNYFRGLRTVGVVSESKDVVEIASPRGVVAAIIPSTNPTSTAIFKVLIAIKSRNAIVLSPHPSAARCINETVRVMREAGIKEGLPADGVACMTTATIEGTEALMKHKQTAVILATGGIGLVRAAYSSGKPAFGVGPGNVPVFIERTADVPKAVQDILTGKTFDNGTICASEQAVVCDAPIEKAVREQFKAQGGHFLSAAEADQLGKIVATPQRSLNPGIVGKSVEVIAKMAGLNVPAGTRCLMVDVAGVGREYPLSMEKLSPILAFYVVDGLARGAERCYEILRYGGMGHTAGVHTRSREAAVRFGGEMPASRITVNTPTTHGAIGFSTALPPSMTLGCGSWGGNVTSDNVSPLHLLDIKRVAFEVRPVKSKRPAVSTGVVATPPPALASAGSAASAPTQPQAVAGPGGKINREDIAAIVDRFLAGRQPEQPASGQQALRAASEPPGEAGSMYAGPGENQKVSSQPSNAAQSGASSSRASSAGNAAQSANGHKTVDFVSEDDVKRALQKGEKIYINAKTIITPAARDIGEPGEVFAKG
ncbi:MAG TPA: aldehyde dehydrogenase family protein [Pyrinomonadaceae bacterium]|jgi:acetaldehyde dehydrogenase (acetylating)|nr:aldehyde dehydrogenase family protein [Pyrinomonadaceae bacterium]